MERIKWKNFIKVMKEYITDDYIFVFDIDGTISSFPFLSVGLSVPSYESWTRIDIYENGYLGKFSHPNPILLDFIKLLKVNQVACLSVVQTSFEQHNKEELLNTYFPNIIPEMQWFCSNNKNKKIVLEEMQKKYNKKIIMIDDDVNVFKDWQNENIIQVLIKQYNS